MKNNFCCPECHSRSLTLIEEKRPFSWGKALIGYVFLGVIGLLFGFLGQDNQRVSAWRCDNCRSRFQHPIELLQSIKKNETSIEWYFKYLLVLTFIAIILLTLSIGLLGALMAIALENILPIIVAVIIALLIDLFILICNLIIKYAVSSFIDGKKNEAHSVQAKMNNAVKMKRVQSSYAGTDITNDGIKNNPNAATSFDTYEASDNGEGDIQRDKNGLWHLPNEQW